MDKIKQVSGRKSGILLPVFSLPSKHGIGCFSDEAFSFINSLREAGQSYWQILPLCPSGLGSSPYQPLSCFAGDPVYIDPETLAAKGLLTRADIEEYEEEYIGSSDSTDSDHVDYEALLPPRMKLLRRAFQRFNVRYAASHDRDISSLTAFDEFCSSSSQWLDDYAVFTAIRKCTGRPWYRWDDKLKVHDQAAISEFTEEHRDEIRFIKWVQYEFSTEWRRIKDYAESNGIEIIGDVPIYAAYDSADCWSHPELFKLDSRLRRTAVSGCPPDAFSEDGQMWGNPLYRWNIHRKTGYSWWISRFEQDFKKYDVIRIDHIRGIESYYSIPAGSSTAAAGRWVKGPGYAFFKKLRTGLGERKFIAEDLGTITPAVNSMLRKTGFPGMKVLQFAFDDNPENPYLLENIDSNSVVYTGTHDNDTTRGWYRSLSEEQRAGITAYIRKFTGAGHDAERAPAFGSAAAAAGLVKLAFISRADTCIIPMQDYLLLGSEGRINTPGTVGHNWEWRMKADAFTPALKKYILDLTEKSRRI